MWRSPAIVESCSHGINSPELLGDGAEAAEVEELRAQTAREMRSHRCPWELKSEVGRGRGVSGAGGESVTIRPVRWQEGVRGGKTAFRQWVWECDVTCRRLLFVSLGGSL